MATLSDLEKVIEPLSVEDLDYLFAAVKIKAQQAKINAMIASRDAVVLAKGDEIAAAVAELEALEKA